ncbi:MAG: Maf family protein [Candidatus Borkfalkiaceae bacterium]|nr:Maf family protein [Christensenellaceae bacterium]
MNSDKKLILASKSPRRIEILKSLGYKFEIIPAVKDEIVDFALEKSEMVERTAENKAREIIESYPKKVFNAGVIGMDTVVVLNGEVLQKPSSKQNQREMLKKLSGAYHEVYTGYCLFVLDEKCKITDKICGAEKSRVLFNDLSDKKIENYIESELGLDKAGGYGIQDEFDLVKSVEGSVFNVIGFPKELFENILKKYDFERN